MIRVEGFEVKSFCPEKEREREREREEKKNSTNRELSNKISYDRLF